MINDPHPHPAAIGMPKDSRAFGRGMLQYFLRVTDARNCVLVPRQGVCVLVVATRDIAVGDELLAPYGYEYWCNAGDSDRLAKEYMAALRGREQVIANRIMKQRWINST